MDTSLYSPDKRSGMWRKRFGEDKFICLYVGRLSFEKGIDYYIDAIKQLNQTEVGQRIEFVFAGDGPYRETLEQYQISNVHLTGFVRGEMLARLYADADAFIFPSGTETFGNVLLEAMASGLPCVCVDEGGVTDFAKDRENAVVVPYRNAEALKEVIMDLLQNKLLCKRLSMGALRTASERSWDGVMDRLLQSYKDLINSSQEQKYMTNA